ncbi:MAG: PaaI family thioesterase [Bacteroidales bacterium]|nr:PaaI family thioesterase [Bacteroidales bacterium]
MTNLTHKAQEVFAQDLYATQATGVVIESVEPRHARCSLMIEPTHRNAMGAVMGGVMFTLADLAFAAAANAELIMDNVQIAYVSLSSTIQYLAQPRGQQLLANATCVRQGRSTCVYQILITDELGNQVALITTTGMRAK